MDIKKYTTFGMIEAILTDNTKAFVSDDDFRSKVRFDTENDEIVWARSATPFQCNYLTIYEYKWTEIKTIKFDDWEVGKVYNEVGDRKPIDYALFSDKICMSMNGSRWIDSLYDINDAREIDWIEKV